MESRSMLTLDGLLDLHARYRPQHNAIDYAGQSLSFAELNLEVNRLANALLATGLTKGDRFATVLPNCIELMAAYCAAAASGLVIVPCSPLLQTGGLKTLLNDSGSKMVITDDGHLAGLESILPQLPLLETGDIVVMSPCPQQKYVGYSTFVGEADSSSPQIEIDGADVFNIMYSSGTTGLPKGIVHTHQIRCLYGTLFASSWRMTPESVVLHAGSMVFNGAMLVMMPWLFLGCRFVLHRKFDPEEVIADVEKFGVTHLVMVPAQIISLLNSPGFNPKRLASLEMLHNVGAPLHLQYKKTINQLLPDRFYELYGVTEGFMTILDKTEAVVKQGSVGKPMPFTRIAIIDEGGNHCQTGEIGEICGKGPLVMPGYHDNPGLTNQAFTDGWLRSGDLGFLDGDGYLFLVDRKKDMIISGGVNVYPKDIEEIVIQHPSVDEVAVFGINHEKWGEAPVASVIVNCDIKPEVLKEWVNQRVDAKFQRLVSVIVLEHFPRNVAGKILKRELKETYRTRS